MRHRVDGATVGDVGVVSDGVRIVPVKQGTRALLLEEIRVPGISAAEKTLLHKDLEDADQVFITSTTRDFLPASHVDGLKVRSVGNIVAALTRAFEEYRAAYVKRSAPLVRQAL